MMLGSLKRNMIIPLQKQLIYRHKSLKNYFEFYCLGFPLIKTKKVYLKSFFVIDNYPGTSRQITMIHVQNEQFWNSTFLRDHNDKQNRRPFISKQAQKELANDWMYIDNGKYNTDNWMIVFERMKKSKAKRLILQKNDRPSLVKQLSTINFIHLNVLNLKSNKICNIEALSFINCPILQWLYLDNNNIISLQPLVKSKLTQLKKLHFNENQIKQVPGRLGLGKCFLSFEAQISAMNRITQEDLTFLVKMNTMTIRSITFCAKKRIKQPKLYEAIEDRFNYIHFYDSHLEMIYNRPMFL